MQVSADERAPIPQGNKEIVAEADKTIDSDDEYGTEEDNKEDNSDDIAP